MIIISNKKVPGKTETCMTYDKFKELAYGEGLDVGGHTLYLNVEDLENNVYKDLKDSGESLAFFTMTGAIPSFISSANEKVENWIPTTTNAGGDNTVLNSMEDNIKPSEPTDDIVTAITSLIEDSSSDDDNYEKEKDAKIYVFGSSKGGTGKTFTAVMATYRYAKTHPHEKIALIDFDIIDGQVGISIHRIKPTVSKYYSDYCKGYTDFNTMSHSSVKGGEKFPQNVDFYLAPNNGTVIQDNPFWLNILENCKNNYDVVVIDTGIDYLNISPISYAYKIADKVILVTTTSIKSVNSVTKQIDKLKGDTINETFSADDEIGPRLNVVITQMEQSNKMNRTIYSNLMKKCNVLATFGVITASISEAEYFGQWDVFDNKPAICKAFDDIMA